MNKLFYILISLFFLYSCKPVKKVEKINSAITKLDTAQTVNIKHIDIVDSLQIIKNTVKKSLQQRVLFNTFNAKIKVDYSGQESSDNYTIYLSMQKDSIIYLQIKGLFGVVGLQAIIDKDSVTIYKKVGDKYIQKRAISYLKEVTQIPFTFSTLQDLLIGNPVFVDSNNIVSYRTTNNNQLLVLTVGNIFKNLLTISNENLLITHSKLDDVELNHNRTCDITYSNFVPLADVQFSTYRSISVAEKSKLDVNMDFKEFTFNEPLKYTFIIPKKLKNK